MCAGFWQENLKEADDIEDLGLDGWIILQRILKKQDGREWTEFLCCRE